MTISHFNLLVPRAQFSCLLAFYTKLLAPLSYQVDIGPIASMNNITGFAPLTSPNTPPHTNRKSYVPGTPTNNDPSAPARGFPDFWLKASDAYTPTHIAFDAPTHEAVREFYMAGIEAGGRGNGEPGVREEMSRQPYYAAFVVDEVGNNIEAVCLSGGEE